MMNKKDNKKLPTWTGAWKLPPCNSTCELKMANDKCDMPCNVLECLWDGGDCDSDPVSIQRDAESKHQEEYYQSLDYVNIVRSHSKVTSLILIKYNV